jgi:serine/threonine protein kinase
MSANAGDPSAATIALAVVASVLGATLAVVVVLYLCRPADAVGANAPTEAPAIASVAGAQRLDRGTQTVETTPSGAGPPTAGASVSADARRGAAGPGGKPGEAVAASPAPLARSSNRAAMVAQIRAQQYQQGRLLGSGSSGAVHLCVLQDGSLVAMKIVRNVHVSSAEQVRTLTNELRVNASLEHPNIMACYFAALDLDEDRIVLFLEYCHGGSLSALVKRHERRLDEAIVRRFVAQIVVGLTFLHDNRIIHRDIKAENIFLDAGGVVKLGDFGAAKKVVSLRGGASFGLSGGHGGGGGGGGDAGDIAGTPLWMAPEMINPELREELDAAPCDADSPRGDSVAASGRGVGPIGGSVAARLGTKADVWSLGITVAELVNQGDPPWPEFDTPWQALLHIGRGALPAFPAQHVSPACLDFMTRCCRVDPRQRPSAAELGRHEWIADLVSGVYCYSGGGERINHSPSSAHGDAAMPRARDDHFEDTLLPFRAADTHAASNLPDVADAMAEQLATHFAIAPLAQLQDEHGAHFTRDAGDAIVPPSTGDMYDADVADALPLLPGALPPTSGWTSTAGADAAHGSAAPSSMRTSVPRPFLFSGAAVTFAAADLDD